MFKRTVRYKDFNGQDRSEDLWFHISKTEFTKLEFSTPGGFSNKITRVMEKAQNNPEGYELMELFNEIIDLAYGVRSEDGLRFRKSPEILADFHDSACYDTFVFDLMSNPDSLRTFIEDLIPKDYALNEEVLNQIDESTLTPEQKEAFQVLKAQASASK